MESHAEAAEGAEPLPAQASRMASLYQREALNQIQREALCVLCELCVSLFARGVSRRGRGGRRATPGAGLADGQPLSARSPQSDSARSPLRSLRSLRELFTARGNLTQRPRRAQSHSRQASRKASLYQREASAFSALSARASFSSSCGSLTRSHYPPRATSSPSEGAYMNCGSETRKNLNCGSETRRNLGQRPAGTWRAMSLLN